MELASSLAISVAISLAEWENMLSVAEAPTEEDREEARIRSVVLLSLVRALEEYDGELDLLLPEEDPRPALPLASALGASYSLLALGGDSFSSDLMLSPHRLQSLLTEECSAFIRNHGEEEAVRLIEENGA